MGYVTPPAGPRATEYLGPWLTKGLVFSRSAKILNFYMKSGLYRKLLMCIIECSVPQAASAVKTLDGFPAGY